MVPAQCEVWSAHWSPDGRTIAVGDRQGHVHLYTGAQPPRTLDCKGGRIPMIAFSPDSGSIVCAATAGSPTSVWDLRTDSRRFYLNGHRGQVRAVAYAPDGHMIASGGDDRTVRVWSASDGSLLRTIVGLPWRVFDLKYHQGGNVLFVAGPGRELLVLDPLAGVQLASLNAADDAIFSLAVGADGRIFVAGQDPWIGIIDLDRLAGYVRGNRAFRIEQAAGAR